MGTLLSVTRVWTWRLSLGHRTSGDPLSVLGCRREAFLSVSFFNSYFINSYCSDSVLGLPYAPIDSGSYKQEEDLKQSRNHSLNRSRANSYDNLGLSSRSSEPGPLAHIPSANPDQIDGLQSPQSGSDVDGLLPPLNFMDISNFSDSPVSSTTTLQGSLASSLGTTHISSANSEKTGAGSVYMHPGMNSSAPALSLMAKGDENASLGQRSQTTPAPSSKKITFAANLSVYDTFSPGSYDRRSEPATCNHLTPALAQRIKEELNSYKMEEMEVHFASRAQ